MVQNNRGFGKRTCQLDKVVELVVVQPSLERQPIAVQVGKSLAILWVREHVRRGGLRAHRWIRVAHAVADAAKTAAGSHLRFENRRDVVPEQQISAAHNRRRNPRLAPNTAGAFGGDTIYPLHLANDAKGLGTVCAMHRAGLDEYGLANIVSIDIGQDVFENVGYTVAAPQVVVRVDDRDFRLDHGFHHLRQPLACLSRGGGGGVRHRCGYLSGTFINRRCPTNTSYCCPKQSDSLATRQLAGMGIFCGHFSPD